VLLVHLRHRRIKNKDEEGGWGIKRTNFCQCSASVLLFVCVCVCCTCVCVCVGNSFGLTHVCVLVPPSVCVCECVFVCVCVFSVCVFCVFDEFCIAGGLVQPKYNVFGVGHSFGLAWLCVGLSKGLYK
jgi:hypothetical protein